MTADHTVAEAGYQERDDCAKAVRVAVDAARAEFPLTKYTELEWMISLGAERAKHRALRAAIEALADKWEGDRLNRVIDKEGAAYLLRDALKVTS